MTAERDGTARVSRDEPNPYRPPMQVAGTEAARVDWRRAARVAGLWLVGASTLSGGYGALRTCWALEPFGAIHLGAPISAIAAFRSNGPYVGALAAAVGLFAGAHEHLFRNREATLPLSALSVVAVVPIVGFVAAAFMAALAFAVAGVGFDAPLGSSWENLKALLVPLDLLIGVAQGGAFAALVAVLLAAGGPWLARRPYRFAIKIVILFLVLRVTTGIVVLLVDLASPAPLAPMPELP